jgi:RNA polymerase sigma-70 factor, ECF subfamily
MDRNPARRQPVGDLQEHRDRQVLGRVAHGDQDALAELFRRYGPASLGLARRILSNQELAEEVLQEVFLAVWRRAAGYDALRGSVRSWILTQIHNKAVDVVRHEQAQRRRAAADPVPFNQEPSPDDVVEEAWIDERRQQVHRALERLSREHRQVIELTYFGGMTQSQAARAAGMPLGTVKSRTLAAMRRMREALSLEGDR